MSVIRHLHSQKGCSDEISFIQKIVFSLVSSILGVLLLVAGFFIANAFSNINVLQSEVYSLREVVSTQSNDSLWIKQSLDEIKNDQKEQSTLIREILRSVQNSN